MHTIQPIQLNGSIRHEALEAAGPTPFCLSFQCIKLPPVMTSHTNYDVLHSFPLIRNWSIVYTHTSKTWHVAHCYNREHQQFYCTGELMVCSIVSHQSRVHQLPLKFPVYNSPMVMPLETHCYGIEKVYTCSQFLSMQDTYVYKVNNAVGHFNHASYLPVTKPLQNQNEMEHANNTHGK